MNNTKSGPAKGLLMLTLMAVAVIAGGWTWYRWSTLSLADLVILWSSAVLLGVLSYIWLLARRQRRQRERTRMETNNHGPSRL